MYFLDGFILYIFDEFLDGVHAIFLLLYVKFGSDLILDDHKFLPIIQSLNIAVGISFFILTFQKPSEDIIELALHQKISHGLNDIMMSADGQ